MIGSRDGDTIALSDAKREALIRTNAPMVFTSAYLADLGLTCILHDHECCFALIFDGFDGGRWGGEGRGRCLAKGNFAVAAH
jgi:hypothetical protein